MKEVALIGYSGHAFVVAEILELSGYKLIGYFEKKISSTNPLQLDYLGYERAPDFKTKLKQAKVFPAVGDNQCRKKIMEFIEEAEVKMALAISGKATISKYAIIGLGTIVCQGVCVNPFSNIGHGVILNTGAIIEHECNIGDYVHIAPGAVLAGNVHIGESSFIGANAVIKQGVRIGKNVIIGAGTTVLHDVPDFGTWIGNPARKLIK